MSVKNAKTLPKVYFGLHMEPGVAEYREPDVNDGNPYRIMIGEETIRNMNPTFAGRPVYVRHVEEVNLENIQEEADGYVIESFYNQHDGKTWAKFIAVSDKAHEAIRNGWQLSNAYIPKEMSSGGLWHGVEYAKEVMRGEFEHLAIVPNPRYENSVILTPEQFKAYNQEKEIELKRLANSKKGDGSMLDFFKKTKVENSSDLEKTSVTLPKSKREVTITQLVNEMDEYALKMKEPQMANGDHHVMVGEEKMKVNDLVEKHMAMKQEHEEMKKKLDAMGGDSADKDAKAAEGKGAGELVPNAEEEEKKKKENEAKEAAEKLEKAKQNAADAAKKKENFDKLANAPSEAAALALANLRIETSDDQVARGKSRYGSN